MFNFFKRSNKLKEDKALTVEEMYELFENLCIERSNRIEKLVLADVDCESMETDESLIDIDEKIIMLSNDIYKFGEDVDITYLIDAYRYRIIDGNLYDSNYCDEFYKLCDEARKNNNEELGLYAAANASQADVLLFKINSIKGLPYEEKIAIKYKTNLDIIELAYSALQEEYIADVYAIMAFRVLGDLDYIEENGISDHWWNAYWHYKAYQYHTAVGNDYNANLSYDNFNNCVERYNLEINDDLLNEWNQDIPFIDESGNLCHPYLHIKS